MPGARRPTDCSLYCFFALFLARCSHPDNRDQVEWDDEQEVLAQAAVKKQADTPVPDELRELYNAQPASYWDEFYANVKGELSSCIS